MNIPAIAIPRPTRRATAHRGHRLVVVSNRVALAPQAASGGLAVALGEALGRHGGLWFGWSGKKSPLHDGAPKIDRRRGISFATIDLEPQDYDDYYRGFANRMLWPLCHYRIDHTVFDPQNWEGYQKVNARFAEALAPLLRPDDVIWVHDYHLILVARELRRLGINQRIGFFLHTPWPSGEVLRVLPVHRELVEALFAFDLIGFQTLRDCAAFSEHVLSEHLGTRVEENDIEAFGRKATIGSFPIGLDAEEFARLTAHDKARAEAQRLKTGMGRAVVAVGVDRLDYSKGLPERFAAFEQMLTSYPETRGRVTLLQIAPPSRSDVPEYRALRTELEGRAGQINSRFADLDWHPIRYLNRPFDRISLAGLYRASRIGVVTPLRDGMNLVAKEYVAAQDESDPGVLVLSEFAGAAQQMEAALIVNPYDQSAVAEAMHRALVMPVEERRERWRALWRVLIEQDLAWWWQRYLDALVGDQAAVPGHAGSIHDFKATFAAR